MTGDFSETDNAFDYEAIRRATDARAARIRDAQLDALDQIAAGNPDQAEAILRSMPVGDIVTESVAAGAGLSSELNGVRREQAFDAFLDDIQHEDG